MGIGADTRIIGNVSVGKGARISANAIVVVDVPDNATVVMDKPRIILHDKQRDNRVLSCKEWRQINKGKKAD